MLHVEVIELQTDHAWVCIVDSRGSQLELRVDVDDVGNFQAPWVSERDNETTEIHNIYETYAWKGRNNE